MKELIRLEATDKCLSSFGGLVFFHDLFDSLANKITTCCSALDKFKAMTLGLVAGADCLDDMIALGKIQALLPSMAAQ